MTLQIDMISDLVCPWCWLGLRRLNTAVEAVREDGLDDVYLRFLPFQLDPNVPAEGVPYGEYMKAKFGPDGPDNKWLQMRAVLEDAGENEGIPFRFSGMPKRINTRNGHRLVRWAQGQNKGAEAKEALMNAYFNLHQDINDFHVLISIAESVGLLPDVVEKLLKEDADLDVIQQEETFVRNLGVAGVPVFIANGKYAMQGAQEVDDLKMFLKTAVEKDQVAN